MLDRLRFFKFIFIVLCAFSAFFFFFSLTHSFRNARRIHQSLHDTNVDLRSRLLVLDSNENKAAAAPKPLLLNDDTFPCFMTNEVGIDGWGSQWHGILSSIVIAAKLRYNFAYSNVLQLEHLNGNAIEKNKDSLREMETYAGLTGLRQIHDVPPTLPRHSITDPYQASCTSPAVYILKKSKTFLDAHPDW
jgi:hypothetical protein